MRIRKPLFIIFLVAYVAILPFLISYALGYDLIASTRGKLVRTGGIFVTSTPSHAQLLIDATEPQRKTPISVISLPSGLHRISLSAEGYRPWSRPVQIRPGEVTVVNDALLIPEQWPKRFITSQRYTDILPTPCGPFLLFRRGPRLADLAVYDTRGDGLITLPIPARYDGRSTITSFRMIPGSASFLVETTTPSSRRVVLQVSIQWPKASMRDVTKLFPGSLDTALWMVQDPDTVYILRSGTLNQIHIAAETTKKLPGPALLDFTVYDRGVYGVDSAAALWRIDTTDGSRERVSGLESLVAPLPWRGDVRIAQMESDFLALQSTGGDFVAGEPSARFSTSDVLGFQALPSARRLIVWKKESLGIVDFLAPSPPAKGATGKKPPTVKTEWVASATGLMMQAWMVYGTTHVLYHGGEDVVLRAPMYDDKDRSVWITAVRPRSSVWYEEDLGRLYLIDKATNRPAWIQVVPQPPPFEGLLQDFKVITGGPGAS